MSNPPRCLLPTALALVATAWALHGCADPPFPPANVYDAAFTTPASIVGFPDTFTAVGQYAQLTLVTDEPLDDVPRRWSLRRVDTARCDSGCGELNVDRLTGRLTATPTSYVRRWEIRAEIGAQLYRDTVVLRQIPRSFQFDCRFCYPTDGFNAPLPFSIQSARLFDANGVALRYQYDTAKSAGASLTSRDPTIVDHVDGVWRSRFTEGSTWLVRQQFGQTDSVLWTVRQVFAPRLTCPDSAALSDTVRVNISVVDATGWPMARPVTITWRLTLWRNSIPSSRSISLDGIFIPTEAGYWEALVLGGRNEVRCGVHVQ